MRLPQFCWPLMLVLLFSLGAIANDTRVGDNFALVIIDMQEPFATRGGAAEAGDNPRKLRDIEARQLEMIRLARSRNMPIVFIEYEDFGDTNRPLRNAVRNYPNARTFTKNEDGMFDSSHADRARMSEFLQQNQVGNLIITGANGGACVRSSIEGALRNNYNVLAYSQGIADFNYQEFIYPYNDVYNYPAPECPSCSFREIDDDESMRRAVGGQTAQRTLANEINRPVQERQVSQDNSERSVSEKVMNGVPTTPPPVTPAPNSAVAQ